MIIGMYQRWARRKTEQIAADDAKAEQVRLMKEMTRKYDEMKLQMDKILSRTVKTHR